jgi:hypothetical protein
MEMNTEMEASYTKPAPLAQKLVIEALATLASVP